jgi:hypothetical protein
MPDAGLCEMAWWKSPSALGTASRVATAWAPAPVAGARRGRAGHEEDMMIALDVFVVGL